MDGWDVVYTFIHSFIHLRKTGTNSQVIRVVKEMKALPIPSEQWPLMAWNILLHAFARLRDGNQAYLAFWSV